MKVTMALLLSFTLLISTLSAQKVSITEIKKFLTIPSDAGAEILISKGFYLIGGAGKYSFKVFHFERNGRIISVDIQEETEFTINHIRICYGKTFQSDYQIIKNQVTKSGKKISFFFSDQYRTYFTEYFHNGLYYYFAKGVCTDTIDNYQNDVLFCSRKSLKNDTKFTF